MITEPRSFAFQLQFGVTSIDEVRRVVSSITSGLLECGGTNLETRLVIGNDSDMDLETRLAAGNNGDMGGEDDTIVNIFVKSDNYKLFWPKAKNQLWKRPNTHNLPRMIITCEGDRGWHNYLLLHTFVEGEKVDKLEPLREGCSLADG